MSEPRVLPAVKPALWAELLSLALAREGMAVSLPCGGEEDLFRGLRAEPGALVLLDFEAFGPGGEAVIGRIRRADPNARVLVLSRRMGEEVAEAVLRAGASGFVGKESPFSTLLAALRAVGRGELWAPRQVTARALDRLNAIPSGTVSDAPPLTRRERDVVEAIRLGRSNKDIANALGISEKTVKTHLGSIFMKTGLHSRFAVALWAREEVDQKS